MQLTVGQAVEILVSEGWLQEPHPELAAACSAIFAGFRPQEPQNRIPRKPSATGGVHSRGQIWTSEFGVCTLTLHAYRCSVNAVALSPDGNF